MTSRSFISFGSTIVRYSKSALASKWTLQTPSTQTVCNQTGMAVRSMSSAQAQFELAKEKVFKLPDEPSQDTQLKLYALFKQATVGKVSSRRPDIADVFGRAKWDAWKSLGDMSQEEAMKAYATLIENFSNAQTASSTAGKYSTLQVSVKGGLRTITLNRPEKFNATSLTMYSEWMAALKEAEEDPTTSVVAVTGAGSYFSAGNDLTNFKAIKSSSPQDLANKASKIVYDFVDAFIEFKKPLIGIVNGPAIGIAATSLALYDVVYASDKAWFQTPFTKLGQSAEGCSSFTYPRMMGPGKAVEMLLFNKKITAHEAHQAGLVTKVFPHETLHQEVWPQIEEIAQLPPQSLQFSKALYREHILDNLKKANAEECERLKERWLSDECKNAIAAFLSRKK